MLDFNSTNKPTCKTNLIETSVPFSNSRYSVKLGKMFSKMVALPLALILFITVPFIILAFTPIYIFRYIVAKTVRFWSPNSGKILSTVSTCMAVDDFSHPQWTVVTTFLMRGNTTFEDFKERYRKEVLERKNGNGEPCTLEFRQYVTTRLGFLFWEWDKDFRIENHVHQNPGDVQYDVLNHKTLSEIIGHLACKPFVPHRSPWEMIFLDNYQSETEAGPFKVAILRSHHAIADAFSLLKLVVHGYFGYEELDFIPKDTKPKASLVTSAKICCGQISTLFRWPYDLALTGMDLLRYRTNAWHGPTIKLTRTMNGAMSDSIPLKAVKGIRNLTGSSFKAILMAAYAGALRKFMSEAGCEVPEITLCGTALPVANHPDDKLRNHATGVLVKLPTGNSGLTPLQRLKTIDDDLLNVKSSSLPSTFYLSSLLVGGLFAWMTKLFSTNSNTAAIASILPGPTSAWTDGGLTVTQMTYAGGLSRGDVGLGFSCFSYVDSVCITVAVDEGLVPKTRLPASHLLEYIKEELHVLQKAAEAKTYDAQNA